MGGSGGEKRDDESISGGDVVCHQKRASVDAWDARLSCQMKRRRRLLSIYLNSWRE